jgi:hypothetical protein
VEGNRAKKAQQASCYGIFEYNTKTTKEGTQGSKKSFPGLRLILKFGRANITKHELQKTIKLVATNIIIGNKELNSIPQA